MKTLIAAVLAVAALVTFATPAEAVVFRGVGRSNVVAVNGGGVNVNVVNQRRGLFGLRNNTRVFVNNGFNNNAVFVNNGRFRNNAVFVNNGFGGVNVAVNNGRFRRNNVVAVNVNGLRFNNFNGARANVFGTQTFVDHGGNVFAVDAFGNTRFQGSAFRGFSNNGVFVNAGFNHGFNSNVVVSNGFNTFNTGCVGNACFNNNAVAVFRGFGGCH